MVSKKLIGLLLICGVVRGQGLEPFPFGAVRPGGWLAAQIQGNLAGFTGHLDSLAPDLILKDDIFGRDRLTKSVKKKDLGVVGNGAGVEVQYLWWNSETQGNWWDGFIRSAVLTGDSDFLLRASAHVQHILATQDTDGYLGVYDRDLRYHFDGENGELWAKTTLLRGLLAWYAYCRDSAVLKAVVRAVDEEMLHYPAGTSRPFYSNKPDVGGLTHGLMFTDILEALYRLTGRRTYLDYASFLYKDFSSETLHEDAQYAKLVDTSYRLQGHGVHTYEHIRAVAVAAYASGDPQLMWALDDFLRRVALEITPSGAPAGDEWIGGRPEDPTRTGYEYCSLQELLDSYSDLMGKTGSAAYGDKVERLFFNAAQGSRDPHTSCIAYLKTDNSYSMPGGRDQSRYKYSPVHQDVAVCCVPNAGRIAPYYVQSMWMQGVQGPVATLLGPCRLHTVWRGASLDIEEKTNYPYDYTLTFVVRVSHPLPFTLSIRKPGWASAFSLSVPYMERDGYLLVTKTWKPGEEIRLELTPADKVERDRTGSVYFVHGPMVLAHEIPARARVGRSYPLAGFYDYTYMPDSIVGRPDSVERFEYTGGGIEASDGMHFRVSLYNASIGRMESVRLVPMGGTILRQVTFPVKP